MATNAVSTDPAPPVSDSVRSAVKGAAASEIVAAHRHPFVRAGAAAEGKEKEKEKEKEDAAPQKAGSGVGDEVDERTK